MLSPCPALGKTALSQQQHVKPKVEVVQKHCLFPFRPFLENSFLGYTLAIFEAERRRQDELVEPVKLLRPVRLRPMLRPPPRAFTICQSLQPLHTSQPPAVSAWLCRPRETVAERRSQRWMAQIAVPRVIRGLWGGCTYCFVQPQVATSPRLGVAPCPLPRGDTPDVRQHHAWARHRRRLARVDHPHDGRVHSAAPARLPPGVRLLQGAGCGGGRSCRRAPPRMEAHRGWRHLAAAAGPHLALLPAQIPSKTATSLSCQSCHSLLRKGPDTPLWHIAATLVMESKEVWGHLNK